MVARTDKKTAVHTRLIWACAWAPDGKHFITVGETIPQIDKNIYSNMFGTLHLCLSGEQGPQSGGLGR